MAGGPIDLSRIDPEETLNSDPALTIVATRHDGVFRPGAPMPRLAPRAA